MLPLQGQVKTDSNSVVIIGEVHDYEVKFGGKAFPVKHKEIHIINKYDLGNSLASGKVKNNQVEFTFYYDEFKQYIITPDTYQATFLLSFYPDADTIYLTIKSEDEMFVKGGELTNSYQEKIRDLDKKFKAANEKITEKYGSYTIYYDGSKTVSDNPVAKQKHDSLIGILRKDFFTTLPKNPDITDYNLFFDNVWSPQAVKNNDMSDVYLMADYLSENIDNPIYDSIASELMSNLKGYYSIVEGKQYVNISATDLNGDLVELKSSIGKSKFLLVDIWAYWCGPCIKKSKNVVPIFNQFKDKGFTVFSVVCDVDDQVAYKKLYKKYNYPWDLYSDIKNQNMVRRKYGVRNSGGIQVLLNKKGEIIMVKPTAKELQEFLSENL